MSVASETISTKQARQPKAKVVALNSPRNTRRSDVIVGNAAQLAELEEHRLVAAYAAADVHAKAAAERRETARKELIEWMTAAGRKLARSAGHLVTKKESERASLDTQRVKAEMGEAWCAARSKVSTTTTLTVTALSE